MSHALPSGSTRSLAEARRMLVVGARRGYCGGVWMSSSRPTAVGCRKLERRAFDTQRSARSARVVLISCGMSLAWPIASGLRPRYLYIKPRHSRRGVVANPRDTTGYRCGSRLATTQMAQSYLCSYLGRRPLAARRKGRTPGLLDRRSSDALRHQVAGAGTVSLCGRRSWGCRSTMTLARELLPSSSWISATAVLYLRIPRPP
jgi:hypothetical protein